MKNVNNPERRRGFPPTLSDKAPRSGSKGISAHVPRDKIKVAKVRFSFNSFSKNIKTYEIFTESPMKKHTEANRKIVKAEPNLLNSLMDSTKPICPLTV